MTWTYDGDPAANDRDEVRFLCGDTDSTDPQVTDEKIAYCVAAAGNNILAAAMVCESLAAQYARDVDVRNGPASESASQRAKQFKAQASDLRRRALSFVKPKFGGQSIADKNTLNADSDVPQPYFRRGQTDAPGSQSHIFGGDNEDTIE